MDIMLLLNIHKHAFKKHPYASDPDKFSQFGVYQIMINDEISLISEQVYTPIPRQILHSEEGILQALSNFIKLWCNPLCSYLHIQLSMHFTKREEYQTLF